MPYQEKKNLIVKSGGETTDVSMVNHKSTLAMNVTGGLWEVLWGFRRQRERELMELESSLV